MEKEKMNTDNQENENSFSKDLINIFSSLISLWKFLLKSFKTLFLTVLVVGIISSLILLNIPNKYTSTTVFIPPPSKTLLNYSDISGLSFSGNLNALPGFNFMKDPQAIYLNLIRSRTVAEKIAREFKIMEKYQLEFISDAVKIVNGMLEVEINEGIISLSVTTENAELSAEIAGKYLDFLADHINDVNSTNIKIQKDFLDKRIEEVRKELLSASEKLSGFKVAKKMVDLESQSKVLLEEKVNLKTKITLLETELEGVRSTYTADSPKAKTLQSQINNLKEELRKITGDNMIREEQKMVRKVGKDVSLAEIPSVSTNYVNLYRDVEVLEQVFLLLIKESELMKIKQSGDQIKFKTIDQANVPEKKSGPHRTLILIGILFLTSTFVLIIQAVKYLFENLKSIQPNLYEEVVELKKETINTVTFRNK